MSQRQSVCQSHRIKPDLFAYISSVIQSALPVLPEGVDPSALLSGKRIEGEGFPPRYTRLINRINRTLKMVEVGAPELILKNECEMLGKAIEELRG